MNNYVNFILTIGLLSLSQLFAGEVTGTVNDDGGSPLIGANVMVEGTDIGAASDVNGNFTISNVPDGSQITASMIGYESQTLSTGGKLEFNLKTVTLKLSAVTVSGNFAKDRETPVAFTTIGEKHIKNNFTVQDIPHLFTNTPGVYVTSDGGSGMGDSKVFIRGFDEQRIAVMINNVPVNDPESKKVYWSNWGSLPAASQAIQIQRGVGSSLYGSGALGGSINVVTKDAPAEKNLGFSSTFGQYGIMKYGIDYSSGLLGGNKSVIARFNYMEGNGWRQNTFYRGLQYYFSAMFHPNNRNVFKVILHGAPQYHAYSYYGFGAKYFDEDKYGRDWSGHPHIAESEMIGEINKRWDDDEVFTDAVNGIYDEGEVWIDENPDGIWNEGEDWVDYLNGIYDGGEVWIDAVNGVYDEGEVWVDLGDSDWNPGEWFNDADGNGAYTTGETFIDIGNGIYDDGEEWTDVINGIYDDGEAFTDVGNGIYDDGEAFTDVGNGIYDEGETFTDVGNGIYDEGEEFTDVAPRDLSDRKTNLLDVLFMKTKIGGADRGGLVVGNGRASFDNNVYHKPQFEIHHSYRISDISKLTSTFFMSRGYGYGENLNRYYYISRDDDGLMTYDAIAYGGQYQYRNYSDHLQTGILSSFETKAGDHDLTFGAELRWWRSRHAGEILNTFNDPDGLISYYIGNTKQKFAEGDLYYDYTTEKPQVTVFGHGLWKFGKLNLMTDIQFSHMNYHVVEDVPSSNNYGANVDDDYLSNGNGIWSGSATWDHDDSTDTEEIPVKYGLWDYEKTFYFVSPKIGLNYNFDKHLTMFVNYSQAVNEPRVKYFFGYGSPNDNLKLETTSDYEFGLTYNESGVIAKFNLYRIDFAGKALQITDPSKTNTPGYDYKGRRYIPIGESTYSGVEFALNKKLPMGIELGLNFSKSANLWGEPESSEGSQYLYSNADIVAGVDFEDADTDGSWDKGETALHEDFVKKFGARFEVSMPQLIYGGTLNWNNGPLTLSLAMRHYEDLYILENNSEVSVEGHYDDGGNWISDNDSATLPPATIVDLVARYNIDIMGGLTMSLHMNNILDTEYWQTGDGYGFKPGAARTIMLNLGVEL